MENKRVPTKGVIIKGKLGSEVKGKEEGGCLSIGVDGV